MYIERIRIRNYKGFKDKILDFDESGNILVGENEVGKTTIIEAIQIVLTGKLNHKSLTYSLNTHLFNNDVVSTYVSNIQNGVEVIPPLMFIEAYFNETPETVRLIGNNNSLKMNQPGVRFSIEFDESYSSEYMEYIRNKKEIITIPIEYYTIKWYSFAYEPITQRSIPTKIITIDNNDIKNDFSLNNYISRIVDDTLSKEQKASLSLGYRKLTEAFSEDVNIIKLNELLKDNTSITDKIMKLTIATSGKNSWERNISLHLDEIPFEYIGSGEKNKIHTLLSIEMDDTDAKTVLIEEPENNLSYGNMRKLVKKISEKSKGKQLIITTHDPYILNKLGIESTILLKSDKDFRFNTLSKETRDYFKKIPGYDTLRLILSNNVILVEGPSDELILKKAYLFKNDKLPLDDGVDILCVNGLSFKRFLEISRLLDMEIIVVTDNDGDIKKNILSKYEDYIGLPSIKILYDMNEDNYTLEKSIVECNDISLLNKVFGTEYNNKDLLVNYMINNKTKCALKIFENESPIIFPEYILNAC